MKSATDVIVVGAGPVGLLNALGLAKAGLSVKVIEREPAIVQSPRAVVYHWAVLDGLARLGVLDEAKTLGFTKQDYSYRIYSTEERIDFDIAVLNGRTEHPYNLHLGQHKLAEVALRQLTDLGVEVHFGTELKALDQDLDGVNLRAEGPEGAFQIRAAWVIGADGARSTVRKLVGYGFDGLTWPDRFVATNIRFDFELHGYNRSNMVVDGKYGAIIAKIDETGLWRCTYCESASLPEASILSRMEKYFHTTLPGDKEYELEQYSPYKMHQRAATSMRAGRVLLAGDAAHATNPTGGLGLTSGLFDAYLLYPTLAAVIRGTASEGLLDVYAEERKRVFVEKASPAAIANKEFIYHSSDPDQLEAALTSVRRLVDDEEAQLERAMRVKRLESRPLV